MVAGIIFHPPSSSLVFSSIARGNHSISASISTVINTTSEQFSGNGEQLTFLSAIKDMLNMHTVTFSLRAERKKENV